MWKLWTTWYGILLIAVIAYCVFYGCSFRMEGLENRPKDDARSATNQVDCLSKNGLWDTASGRCLPNPVDASGVGAQMLATRYA